MVVTTAGKNRILNLIDGVLDVGELGLSSQTPAITDTDLILGSITTSASVSGTVTGKQLAIDYNLNSVTGNGLTYVEYGTFLSDGTLLDRAVFTGVPKTASIELNVKTILNID